MLDSSSVRSALWGRCAVTICLTGCADVADPAEQLPPQGTPQQFMLVEDPEVRLLNVDVPRPDSEVVVFILTVPDSTPHRGWWPTRLEVETDRGFRTELLVAPYACVDSIPSGPRAELDWPLNFDWWDCDRVGFNNTDLLTVEQVYEVEETIRGRLMWVYPFQTMPGGQYEFRVGVGRSAVEEAINKAGTLSFIQGDRYHPRNEPPCVTSDIVPPPPCPPWSMLRHEYFTFGQTPGDSLPVSHGGWIKATYVQSDGTRRVGVLEFQ